MPVQSFITYFLILFFATIIPGPSMLLALNHGANHGFGKTILSGLGNLIGNLLMALLSIFGLGVLLLTSGLVFNVIKWLGIAYLVFIGIKMIIEPVKAEKTNNITLKSKFGKSSLGLFVHGFFIAVSNPKGILFFTALFPQFINMEDSSMEGFLIIFITLGVVAFGCYMLYALLGIRINRLFQLDSFKKIYNRITGTLFIGVGILTAFSKR